MEVKAVYTQTQSWKTYPYKKDTSHPKHMTKQMYYDIINAVTDELLTTLVTTGERVNLPSRMGSLQAVRYKTSNDKRLRSIDYNTTDKLYKEDNKDKPKEDRKLIRHNNYKTGGYWCRIHWFKRREDRLGEGTRFRNSQWIAMKMCRSALKGVGDRPGLYPEFRKNMWTKYREL